MKIKIGDMITYRGGFGTESPKRVSVVGLTLTDTPRSKYGEDVREVARWQIDDNRVLFSLDDGHWCYSEQVTIPNVNQTGFPDHMFR